MPEDSISARDIRSSLAWRPLLSIRPATASMREPRDLELRHAGVDVAGDVADAGLDALMNILEARLDGVGQMGAAAVDGFSDIGNAIESAAIACAVPRSARR